MAESEASHKRVSREKGKGLYSAVRSGNKNLVKTLLAKGTSLNDILTPVDQNKTSFHIAIDKFDLGIINLFLSQFDVEAFDDKYFLHYAVEENNIQVLPLLIKQGFSLINKNEKNCTPFCIALKNENLKVLGILLTKYDLKDIDKNDDNHLAPAYIASICGNLKFIRKYLGLGLPINLPLKLSTNSWSSLANYTSFTLLHLAVKSVKLKIVEVLMSAGADIFVQNENGSSPLHVAFETKEIGIWETWSEFHGNNSIIDLILNANTKFKSNPINKNGLSHFHIACSRDLPEVVEHFIELGAPINEPVNSKCHLFKKFSPLHFAAKFRCKKTMELLLKNGANVKQKDSQNMTALHIAVRESCLDVINLLLQYGAEVGSVDSHGNTPIHLAFKNRNYKVIDLLLSIPNVANSNITNKEGLSHFHIACTRNNVDVVKSFIKKEGKVIINTCVPVKRDLDENCDDAGSSGFSPLHFAVSHNRSEIVELLLYSNADVGIKDKSGCTPFHTVCQSGYTIFGEFIENILCKRGKLYQLVQPHTDVTNIVEYTSKFSGSIDTSNYGSIHGIDWSANRKDHLKIINLLLKFESDINCIDNFGNAPLFYAYSAANNVESILKNNLDCSERLLLDVVRSLSEELYERRKLIIADLLKLKVNLDKCYKNDPILLYISSNYGRDRTCCESESQYNSSNLKYRGSYEMMELFLKNGANINASADALLAPLLQATVHGRTKLVTMLLNYGANVDCIDPKDNSTPLLIAFSKYKPGESYDEIIDVLLDKGANPNAKRIDGTTALHIVAWKRESRDAFTLPTKIRNLMKAGANVNCQDVNGLTPLHEACDSGNWEAITVLLSCGADVNVENNEGRSVSCCASRMWWSRYERSKARQLYKHIYKMSIIGLLSSKALSSFLDSNYYDQVIYYENKEEWVSRCRKEVKALQDTKINDDCSLHDVLFKSENTLSRLVKNPAFRNIVKSESFNNSYPYYGYLVQLKYQNGEDRAELLPVANGILSQLARLNLPDSCSENICKYFTNADLGESIKTLSSVLNSEKNNPDNTQWRGCQTNKRQKVD